MMNKKIVVTFFLVITTISAETITNFAHAADVQNDKDLELLLDDNFRLVLNQMLGNNGIVVMTKQDYLANIKAKKFGGDKREVTIQSLTVYENNAAVQVIFKGDKFTVVTFLQLIKTGEGNWKLINDLPAIGK